MKATDYMAETLADVAFVSTNSICQGIQVSALWPTLFGEGAEIRFAYQSFKWANLAAKNAGVSVAIIGLTRRNGGTKQIFIANEDGVVTVRTVSNISPYLVPGDNVLVSPRSKVPDERAPMQFGNHPYYANELMLSLDEASGMVGEDARVAEFIRPLYGSRESISGTPRTCLWITDENLALAQEIPAVWARVEKVRKDRKTKTKDVQAKKLVETPWRFRDQYEAESSLLVVPIVSSENRPYLPVVLLSKEAIVHNKAFALYDAPLWNFALIVSKMHLVWVAAVCVRLEMRYSYSNTLGWNTFPVPTLTEQNKADLTRCAEDILLARESHYPATIADLYGPDNMPDDLLRAHERNDEVLERIYIGRRFRNDTERLEKLFDLYTKMTAGQGKPKKKAKK